MDREADSPGTNTSMSKVEKDGRADNLSPDTGTSISTSIINPNREVDNPSPNTGVADRDKRADNTSIGPIQKSRQARHRNRATDSKSNQ